MCLKINRCVKTPWRKLSMGVARSGLWAPVDIHGKNGEEGFTSDEWTGEGCK